jgi:DNA processing protein
MNSLKNHESKFRCLTADSSDFPVLLSLIKNPPKQLYCIGDVSLLKKKCIAIVGSRRATEYGKWAAFTLAKRLSDYGVVVVSGMARGVDSFAHLGALKGSSPTIAVLGTGPDICHPASNRRLMQDILYSGLVITEYSPGTRASKFTFPQRNRIISGLCYATVVVEAGLSSGSLITAERAVEQGREVYAVPGNINRQSSIGCNKLIRDGARPLVFIDDVLADLGIETNMEETLVKSLSVAEQKLYSVIKKNGEIRPEDAGILLGMGINEVSSLATILEMKGLVWFANGKLFVAN